MGLLSWLRANFRGKTASEPAADQKTAALPEEEYHAPEIYSGMRVEVTVSDGRLLFVAKLQNLRGAKAELHQYSETSLNPEEESLPVRIRGYNDRTRKAVYMEGVILPQPKHVWAVEELTVVKIGNDRAFFRLDTNLEATATTLGGGRAGERSCKLLNISVGGARIRSEHPYEEGEKFLLTVKLLEDRDASVLFCQVLRALETEDGGHEYGCQFLGMKEADEEQITENIFAAQRKARNGL